MHIDLRKLYGDCPVRSFGDLVFPERFTLSVEDALGGCVWAPESCWTPSVWMGGWLP